VRSHGFLFYVCSLSKMTYSITIMFSNLGLIAAPGFKGYGRIEVMIILKLMKITFIFFLCYRLMMTEAYTSLDKTLRYYGTSEAPIGHFPFNFFLLKLNFTSNAKAFKDTIYDWLDHMPEKAWPNWVVGCISCCSF